MQRLQFPEGFTKDSPRDFLIQESVTEKGIIPTTNSDLATPDTQLARHQDAERNELIYRGVGHYVNNTMTVDEILTACDLDWNVVKMPSYFKDLNGNFHSNSKFYGIVRKGTNKILSQGNLASKNWQIYQNRTVVENFRNFCVEGNLELERVGSLKDGQIIFAVAQTDYQFELSDNDITSGKIIITNSHKPGEGVKIFLMAIRKVCTNCLNVPVRTNGVIIRHNSKLAEVVPKILATAKNNFQKIEQESQLMSSTPLTKEEALAILIQTFGNPQLEIEEQPKVVTHCLNSFTNQLDTGSELLSAFQTAYGLLNSITHYYNHNKVNSVGSSQINSLWLGSKAQYQQKAYRQIVQTCTVRT